MQEAARGGDVVQIKPESLTAVLISEVRNVIFPVCARLLELFESKNTRRRTQTRRPAVNVKAEPA